jgi:hypothetical protein
MTWLWITFSGKFEHIFPFQHHHLLADGYEGDRL